MKAITIWQPWATLLAIGAKKYETRSWATNYRGPIAIHAAVKRPPNQGELPWKNFEAITHAITMNLGHWRFDWDNIPRGCIIATAELVNCWHIVYHPGTDVDVAKHINIGAELDVPKHHPDFHKYIVPTEEEMLFGDWTPGRYAWEFANIKMLQDPILVKGQQRLWNWEEEDGTINQIK